MTFLIRLVTCGVLAIPLASCSGPHDHEKLDFVSSGSARCLKFDEYQKHIGNIAADSLQACATTKFIEKLLPQLGGKELFYVSSQLTKEGFSCGQTVINDRHTKTVNCSFLHHWFSPHLVIGYDDLGYWDWTVVATKHAINPIKIVVTSDFAGDELPKMENRK